MAYEKNLNFAGIKRIAMAKPAVIKTTQNAASVTGFLETIADEQKKKDSYIILKLMEKAMGEAPKMWGSAMIGFGKLRYKSPATGREVDWFKIGFSPRKANLSLHLMDLRPHADALLQLGKHKTGAGCLYINKLEDIDMEVLKQVIAAAAK